MTSAPSSPTKRARVFVLACCGLAVASYLTAVQLGVVGRAWEPFFGDGSERVLHSWISGLLPVPDASLGALAYAAEVVLVVAGGRDRWRSHPWLVIAYGAVTAGLGLVAVLLLAMQAFVLHAWCTLCLSSATISLVLVALAAPEVLSSIRYLRARAHGGPIVFTEQGGIA